MGKKPKDPRRGSEERAGDQKPPPGRPLAPNPSPTSTRRQPLVALAGLVAIGLLVAPVFLLGKPRDVTGRTLSEVLTAVDRGSLDHQALRWIEIDDNSRAVILTLDGGSEVAAHYPDYFGGELVARLERSGIPFETAPIAGPSIWGGLALSLLPVLLTAGQRIDPADANRVAQGLASRPVQRQPLRAQSGSRLVGARLPSRLPALERQCRLPGLSGRGSLRVPGRDARRPGSLLLFGVGGALLRQPVRVQGLRDEKVGGLGSRPRWARVRRLPGVPT